jgi:candidate lytic murein transglycosylase; glycoside hydrolase family 23
VETQSLAEGEFFYYTIRRGDNLWSIAKKYPGVSNRDIMKWNGLSEKMVKNLKPGQKLKIKI